MKKPRILRSFFSLAWLLSLPLCLGCGDTEEVKIETLNPLNPRGSKTADAPEEMPAIILRVESTYKQLNAGKIRIPQQWERTEDPVLRAVYARAQLSSGKIGIPPHWIHTEDPVLRAEYHRAQLIQQFGDIPQVHIVANKELKQAIGAILGIPWFPFTAAEQIAYLEALNHLWPNEVNQRTLEDARNRLKHSDPEKLLEEDPELWAKITRAQLIEKHGDIPQVHTVVDFRRKVARQLPLTDDDYLAYLEAVVHLEPKDEVGKRLLERYQKAKADGIPFKDVNVDDLIPSTDNNGEEDE